MSGWFELPPQTRHPVRVWMFMRRLYVAVVGVYATLAAALAATALGIVAHGQSVDYAVLTRAFAFGAGLLVALYFLIYAWFARHAAGDLCPSRVSAHGIARRNGTADTFSWALYAVILIYGVLYVIVSLRFGQIH